MKSTLYLRFLLFQLFALILADQIKRDSVNGHLVRNSREFYHAIHDKSQALVFLDGNVELRNYYGWVYPYQPTKSSGAVAIHAYDLRHIPDGRPIIDMDSAPLHRLLTDRQSLTAKGLHFMHVHLLKGSELETLPEMDIELEDCIVEVFVNETGPTIRSRSEYVRSLIADASGWPEEEENVVTDWWCTRNQGIHCPDGGVYYYNATIRWTGDYVWHLNNTMLKFVIRRDAEVAIPNAFLHAIENQKSHIAIPYSLELNFNVCKSTTVYKDVTIYDPRRSFPPKLIIDFNDHLYGCIQALGIPTIRVTDFILRDLFPSDGWPVLFPFVVAPKGSTVILENVIIEMDSEQPNSRPDLDRMVRQIKDRKRPNGLGSGEQKLMVWEQKDCKAHLKRSVNCRIRGKCPKEAKCPLGAIFIEDASFIIERHDGHGDLSIGARYRIRHSLITVIPPKEPSIEETAPAGLSEGDALNPSNPTPNDESFNPDGTQAKSQAKPVLLVAAAVIIGVMCAVLLLCGFAIYKYGFFERLSASGDSQSGLLWGHHGKKVGSAGRTLLTPELPSGALPAKHAELYVDYQHMATSLLGSVTLGRLLGAGSFGRVFKATWNGATVAVKVIVHDGMSLRGSAAQREALLSSNLHHPNIVQTFVQTTREIKHDEHVSTAANTHQDYQSETSESNANSGQPLMPPNVDDGYVDLANLVPNDYRPQAPSRSVDSISEMSSVRSFAGDRIETWLIQEYCDMGSLEKAVRKKRFMIGVQHNMAPPPPPLIHNQLCSGIGGGNLHGYLSSNILLNGSSHASKGFIAKVADFGLSRELGLGTHISTQTTGTVTHMPPELFNEQRLTAASDVYSFGIVMWEIVSGESPLDGQPHFVVIKKIMNDKWRPTFSEAIPECYATLARGCWAEDDDRRPPMDQVLLELEHMKMQFQRTLK